MSAMSAAATAAAVRSRTMTASAVAMDALRRIEARNAALNAYTCVLADRALTEAHAVDAAIADGRDPGALAGVPYGVKSLFDVAGLCTRAGSIINRDLPPARQDAVLVRRMAQHGAILLGTQTMDEYAYGFTTENAHDGTTRNPHDVSRVAGGSSGGSAASVAAGLGAVALASDTNGSIRVPASFCGVFGLKPTYGRLPRTGAFPFVFDLDHVGPLARTAEDLALVYDALQGADSNDPACAGRAPEPAMPQLTQFPPDLRIGILDGWFNDKADADARASVAHVAAALKVRARASLPGAEAARASAFLVTAAQGANLHLANLRARAADFDPATRDRLLAGALLPATFVLQAQRVRRWFAEQAAEIFRSFDILLAPATPCAATRIGQETLDLDGHSYPVRPSLGLLTQPLSCIGLPIVCVPICRAGTLPIGVQIIAAPWREVLALQVSAHLERIGAVGAAAVV
jgi:aspartyl-tRNA(Asn)/glutamyl-tRNA(Gln) amidotransferase subunit A